MSEDEFQLGEPVLIMGHTKKRSDWQSQAVHGPKYPRIDHPPGVNPAWGKTAEPRTGFIVGKRTVSEGTGRSERVWVVAYDVRLKPVMAYPEQLRSLNT